MIHLIFAEQDLMAKEAASKAIKKSFPDLNDFNFISLDMNVSSFKAAAYECEMLSLGFDKKCVLLENCNFFRRGVKIKTLKDDDPEALKTYLRNPNPDVELFMVFEGTPDTRGEFYKAVADSNAEIYEVKALSSSDWPHQIEMFFKKEGVGIESNVAYELSKRIAGDYGKYKSETAKLLAYSNGEKITLRMVEELVSPYVEENTYAMGNALLRNDIKGAIKIYHDLKERGAADEFLLMANLASSLRYLDEVRYLDAKGYDKNEIARDLGGTPMRAEIAKKNLYHIKGDKLERALEKLYELNREILTGQIDQELGFSLYLANFNA